MTERTLQTANEITNRRAECEQAVACLAEQSPSANIVSSVRNQFGQELAGILLSMASLQSKAAKKFSENDKSSRVWWVTEKSLQQATAWQVAKLKSSWLGDHRVFDLCCGVGGDAMQLVHRGEVVAVDADPILTAMVDANLSGSQLPGEELPNQQRQHDQRLLATVASAKTASQVVYSERFRADCTDVTQIEIPREAAVHIDPDRRNHGTRSSQVDFYQPDWPQVCRIVQHAPSAIVKVAPAAKIEFESEFKHLAAPHRCWISLRGSVREQAVLCGDAIDLAGLRAGATSAVVLARDGSANQFSPEDTLQTPAVSSKPQSFMIDPDASIRAAGLTETFAFEHNLHLLGSASGFLTCDNADSIAELGTLAVVGHVIWSGSLDDRKLRRELRARQMYPQRIKVRGTGHDVATLARRYRQCGEIPVTLWLGRSGSRVLAALTDGT